MIMHRLLSRALAALLATAMASGLACAAPRRVLHVSLYPYIPDAPAAALALKQGFERQHPDVIVDITLNQNYYSLTPVDKGLLFETADVHEIDVVFLKDFVDGHRLAPLSKALRASLTGLEPLARTAATVKGELVAAPQWMCADFLIYRADKTALAEAYSLGALEQALGPDHGLLMDLKGDNTLGEIYLSHLLALEGDPAQAAVGVGAAPDPEIVSRFQRLLALEPAGFGRRADYDARGVFYARQFARRAGDAFVGYSEMTHEVLDETAVSCRVEDHCVTAPEIRVAAMPFEDGRVRPAVWVDMFAIDAKTHGQSRTDAETFIRYAVSLPAYRVLLIPNGGAAPRYLLPAFQAPFDDPEILKAAPLYPQFRAIMEKGAVVTGPGLSQRLQGVATIIDAALPTDH
jgi:thiamine pyridinylase